MVRLTGPLFSLKAQKQIGKSLIYKTKNQRGFLTSYNKPGGVKKFTASASQVTARAKYYACVGTWRAKNAAQKAVYDLLAKGKPYSGWNLYLAECMAIPPEVARSIDLELGSTQCLRIADGDQTGLGFTGDFSLEVWIKVESTTAVGYIIAKIKDADHQSYWIAISTTAKRDFGFSSDGSGANRTIVKTQMTFNIGQWYHIAVTANVSEKAAGCKIYVDGDAVATDTTLNEATSVFDSDGYFQIGAGNNIPWRWFDGKIDEARVWVVERTPTEILNNYNVELNSDDWPTDYPALKGYWRFNNNPNDQTDNDNDLTPINNPVYSTDVPF